jgi:hypothetical protein
MRLKSGLWVDAYLRRVASAGGFAVLRRRGAAEGGAIFIKIDLMDGRARLIGPAPQADYGAGEAQSERRFAAVHAAETIDTAEAERRIAREVSFDPDLWLVEVEDRQGRDYI